MPADQQPDPLDRDGFARMLIDRLRSAGETAEIHYEPDEFRLRVAGEENHYANLSNLYAEYTSADLEQRQRLLRNYARSWFAPRKGVPDDFADVHPDLLPGVRPRAYIELGLLSLRLNNDIEPDWPYQVLAEHLAVSLVYDLPESLVQIQQHQLDTWGVHFADALRRATDNLIAISWHRFDEVAPGVWRSPWQDNLDASRLVLPELFRAHEVQGDPVVIAPNRDTVLLTGSDDEAGLARLAELAEEAFAQPRAVSGIALRLEAEGWAPFLPPPGHPAYPRLKQLQLTSLGQDYSRQKELLEQLHEATEEDVFVATFSGLRDTETGEVVSFCVWSDTITSLLPVTDRIYFVRPGDDDNEGGVVAAAPWSRVMEVVGDLLTPLEVYPRRYRVSEFPTDEQLAALGMV